MVHTSLSLFPSTPTCHKSQTFYGNTGTLLKVIRPYHNSSHTNHSSSTQNAKTSRTRWYTAVSTHNETTPISTSQQPQRSQPQISTNYTTKQTTRNQLKHPRNSSNYKIQPETNHDRKETPLPHPAHEPHSHGPLIHGNK